MKWKGFFNHNYITLETIHILLMESNQWITKKYHTILSLSRNGNFSRIWFRTFEPLVSSMLCLLEENDNFCKFFSTARLMPFFELSAILSRVLCVGCQLREKFQELNYLLAHVAEMHSAIHVKLRIPVKEKEMFFLKKIM